MKTPIRMRFARAESGGRTFAIGPDQGNDLMRTRPFAEPGSIRPA